MQGKIRHLWQAALAVALTVAPMATGCSDDEDSILPPADDDAVTDTTAIPEQPAEAVLDSTELWCMNGNQRIYGLLYTKARPGERVPAVILSHSYSLSHAAMRGYARSLAEKGMAAYCFDFCGGGSESQSDGSTDSMTVFTEVNDLKAVLATVRGLDVVHPDSVYLLGSSLGGMVSALVAEDEPEKVAGLILFYPAFNMPDLVRQFGDLMNGWGGSMGGSWGGSWGDMGSMFSMSQAFIDAMKDYDVWQHIGTFPRPVAILHGSKDWIVPISNSEKAVGLYPNATLHVIEGANHGFNEANLGGFGSMMGGTADYDSIVMPIVYDFLGR
ncbi:MAG: alpha/beta hydrolase [Bacteroidales bacterium]|nr:alpha/beta hydrolase [Bacteroidales bacterium]